MGELDAERAKVLETCGHASATRVADVGDGGGLETRVSSIVRLGLDAPSHEKPPRPMFSEARIMRTLLETGREAGCGDN